MDIFTAIVVTGIALMFLVFLGLGLLWRRPLEELTDRHANEALAAQATIEEGDIPEMVAASNEYRRKRGRPELTVEQYKAAVGQEQLAILDEANKQLRAKQTRWAAGRRREKRGF